MAEAGAFTGTFNQSRDIGNHETLFGTDADNSEVRHKRRKGIVGNLRARRGDAGDDRALADRGHADERSVGSLEFLASAMKKPSVRPTGKVQAASVTVTRTPRPSSSPQPSEPKDSRLRYSTKSLPHTEPACASRLS